MEDTKFTAVCAEGLAGYEVGLTDDGEYALWRWCPPGKEPGKTHRAAICFTAGGRPYFRAHGRRIHLDECLRKDIGPGNTNR